MNERFDLAWWELSPDSPEKLEGVASGRIKAHWLGDEREFLLREVEIGPEQFVVFAREVDSLDEGNWMLHPENSQWKAMPFDWVGVSLPTTRAPNAMNLFSRTSHVELGRLFHLNLKDYSLSGSAYAFINSQGEVRLWNFLPKSGIKNQIGHRNEESLYVTIDAESLENVSALQWRERLEKEFRIASSNARFALEWQLLSFEQRCQCVLDLSNGDYIQMKRMFTLALSVADFGVSTGDVLDWNYSWEHDESGQCLYVRNSSKNSEEEIEPSEFLCIWRQALLNWFAPTLSEQVADKNWCVRSWNADNHEIFAVCISLPTQHQRLEAALELRDWARGKVSEELIRTLL